MPSVYLEPAALLADRVRDLIARLTLVEKLDQLCNKAPAIPRLGIPAYDYWSEALHGVARAGRATVFPQAIGMSATWNPALIRAIASAIGDEGRAKYHAQLKRAGGTRIFQGLTFWSPNINIFRDPRWGRGQETWGEDPYLTGEMGAAFVRGLQGDHPRYLKTAACAKHFAVHSGPESKRHSFDAVASAQDMAETYLPAFKKLVEAGVEAVMGAYNRTNGEACCASPFLLQKTLRQAWGFTGHVVSDCGALDDIHNGHHLTANAAESAALALKNGCDLGCSCTFRHLDEALALELVTEAEIDLALERVLTTRFKLGMFDPDEMVPYAATLISIINCPEHQQLAYTAALQSAVLLKNNLNALPIAPGLRNICVIGPNAASLEMLLGNYNGMNGNLISLLEGIVNTAPEGMRIDYIPGAQLTTAPGSLERMAKAAAACSLTVACMGLAPLLEGEEGDALMSESEGDRASLVLPDVQVELIHKMHQAGAKIILVVSGGSPIALGNVADLVEAILWIGYPGEQGGQAVADLLFGHASPSGKLTITWPQSVEQLPPFEDYAMTGRTYRYAQWQPLYPFGFGLSYTSFEYYDLHLSHKVIPASGTVWVQVAVANTGLVEADEVVQVYFGRQQPQPGEPVLTLVDFQRVTLKPAQVQRLDFEIPVKRFMLVDELGQPRLSPGQYTLFAGSTSPNPRVVELGAPKPLQSAFVIK